jgi:hypothetical protein
VTHQVKTMDHQAADALAQDRNAATYGTMALAGPRSQNVRTTLNQDATQNKATLAWQRSQGVVNPDAPTLSAVITTPATTTCRFRWNVSRPGSGRVFLGTVAGTYTIASPITEALLSAHDITVTGLTTATLYQYRLESQDEDGNIGFITGTVTTL